VTYSGETARGVTKVSTIIAELHPDLTDVSAVIDRIAAAGFHYIPGGSAWPGSMTAGPEEPRRDPEARLAVVAPMTRVPILGSP
jgi:hypothetical protein